MFAELPEGQWFHPGNDDSHDNNNNPSIKYLCYYYSKMSYYFFSSVAEKVFISLSQFPLVFVRNGFIYFL